MLGAQTENNKNVYKALTLFLVILSVFFFIKVIHQFGDKERGTIGELRTITVSGYGEVSAVPDVAKIHFTISKTSPTVKEAQDGVTEIETQALESLKEQGVEDRDIKTINASFYPKYEYRWDNARVSGRNVLVGYEVSESIEVKVRDTDSAGAIMQSLGALGVSNLSGPNFSVDDEDALRAEARKLAIEKAKAEAQTLAGDLGVRLGKVVSFNEGGGYYPMPLYRASAGMDMAMAESTPPALPVGENTISSEVTIVYEIR